MNSWAEMKNPLKRIRRWNPLSWVLDLRNRIGFDLGVDSILNVIRF